MNPFAILLLIITGSGVFFASRKWAMVSFLVGCCYMTAGEGLIIAGFNMPVFRMLLLVGVLRVVVQGQGLAGGVNRMDKVIMFWAVWLMIASVFHEWTPGSGPKYAAGSVFNVLGLYLMIRSFCRDIDSLVEMFGILCWVLLPLALLMVVEQQTHRNLFSIFGGVPEVPTLRNGRFRAQGPFSHAILAGTVGAGCIPLVISTWRTNRVGAIVGLFSCLLMVGACASSGPIMSSAFAILGIMLWWKRSLVRFMVRAAIPVYILLAIMMERPPYYLISKIDLTGASTGWHRSFLIEQTINYLDEWWLFGTDRTRHWMPSQGRISEYHTDITNQFIAFGVNGGLLSILLVILIMFCAFKVVGLIVEAEHVDERTKFVFWCLGSSLFAHTASSMSIAYFGQAMVFFWLPIFCLAAFARSDLHVEREPAEESKYDEKGQLIGGGVPSTGYSKAERTIVN